MVDLFKEIDFTDQNSKLMEFIKKASDEISQGLTADQINKPYCDSSFSNLILVTNLPACSKEKLQAFNTLILARLFKKLELSDSYENCEYRMNPEKTHFTGNAIFGFKNAESARFAQEKLDGVVIDQKHKLKVYMIQDYENIVQMEDQFLPPKLVTPQEQYEWCLNEFLKDQFIFQEGQKLTIQTFDHLESKPLNPLQIKPQLPITSICFSTQGSYLVTLHSSGFQLFGGKTLIPLNFHKHNEVSQIEFSKDETIILSFNNTVNYASDLENYIVWNTYTAQRLRVFSAKAFDLWGSFQFSFDSKYLARCSPQDHTLSIFELPSMTLTKNQQNKKTSMQLQNIQKIAWVGQTNILCCACYGGQQENQAGTQEQLNTRIMLYQIPSRDKYKSYKNIQWTMTNCTIFPSFKGDWMGLVMNKRFKKKITTVIQIANLKSKEVEISEQFFDNEKIINFAFEPNTRRFAVLYEDPDHSQMKTTAIFYYIDKQLSIKEIDRVVKTKAKEILLPKCGTFFALVDKDQNSPTMGYIQLGYFKQGGAKEVCEVFKEFKQNYLSEASWDPSGRLFLTASRHTKTWQVFTAYQKLLYKDTQESKLDTIIWRNRPIIYIPEEKEQEYDAKFKDLKKLYSEQDDEILKREELMEKRRVQKMKDEFLKFLEEKRKEWNDIKEERRKLRGFDDDNLSDLTMDETIEKEEIIETVNKEETS